MSYEREFSRRRAASLPEVHRPGRLRVLIIGSAIWVIFLSLLACCLIYFAVAFDCCRRAFH